MYQKIMVPLDGSELAECVLPHVESMAKCGGVKEVVFVRVVEPLRVVGGAEIILTDEYVTSYHASVGKEAEDYLAALNKRISYPGIKHTTVLLEGPVDETLVDYVHRNKFDLIIIATHGSSGVSRWVFGGVADRILHFSAVPVLMVTAPGCRIEA